MTFQAHDGAALRHASALPNPKNITRVHCYTDGDISQQETDMSGEDLAKALL